MIETIETARPGDGARLLAFQAECGAPRRLTPGIRSLESATSSASARMRSNRSPLSSASVVSLFCLTQSSACSLVMSSNHRYGSSSTIVTPQRKRSDKRLKDSYQTTDPCARFRWNRFGRRNAEQIPSAGKVHTIESRPAPPFPTYPGCQRVWWPSRSWTCLARRSLPLPGWCGLFGGNPRGHRSRQGLPA